jgi:proteasome lid subunit RPN8/RPN11
VFAICGTPKGTEYEITTWSMSRFTHWVLILQNQRCLGSYTEPYKHCSHMSRRKYRFRRKDLRHLLSIATPNAENAREVCGLLIDNGHFLQLRETRNISKREGSFQLDMREIRSIEKAADKLNLEVVGTFHSHIVWFAKPGEADIEGAENDSLMLLVDSMDKDIKLWRVKNKRAYPLSYEII